MPLSPDEVVNKRFSATKFRQGYDEEEVDEFLDEVVAELRRLTSENEDLKAKLAACERRVGELSRDGGGVGRALAARARSRASTGPEPEPVVAAAPEPPLRHPSRRRRRRSPARPPPRWAVVRPGGRRRACSRWLRSCTTSTSRPAGPRAPRSSTRPRSTPTGWSARPRRSSAVRWATSSRSGPVLERKVEELRAFERDYRRRLKAYLEGQLRDLDALPSAGDGPDGARPARDGRRRLAAADPHLGAPADGLRRRRQRRAAAVPVRQLTSADARRPPGPPRRPSRRSGALSTARQIERRSARAYPARTRPLRRRMSTSKGLAAMASRTGAARRGGRPRAAAARPSGPEAGLRGGARADGQEHRPRRRTAKPGEGRAAGQDARPDRDQAASTKAATKTAAPGEEGRQPKVAAKARPEGRRADEGPGQEAPPATKTPAKAASRRRRRRPRQRAADGEGRRRKKAPPRRRRPKAPATKAHGQEAAGQERTGQEAARPRRRPGEGRRRRHRRRRPRPKAAARPRPGPGGWRSAGTSRRGPRRSSASSGPSCRPTSTG